MRVGPLMNSKTIARRVVFIPLLALALFPASVQSALAGDGFTDSRRRAACEYAPEPLSRWAAVDPEIERLVVTGDLPFEAWCFRPIDIGELAAWLEKPAIRTARVWTPEPESFARDRLHALIAWQTAEPRGPDEAYAAPNRPGTIVHFGDRSERLDILPYLRFMPIFRTGDEGAWTSDSRAGVRAHFTLGSNTAISAGIFAAEIPEGRRFADPLVAGTDFVLHEEEATISTRLTQLRLRVGRDRHNWGPGITGTLLLAEAAEPFNFVEYQFRIADDLRFLALTGVTSFSATPVAEGANPSRRRYLSAHRLMWNVSRTLYLAVSEGARYQTDAEHWLYLSGIVPYTLVERLDMQDERDNAADDFLRNNVLWSIDGAWRFRPGALVYAELMADDIAAESGETPTRGAFQAGVTAAPRWRGWDWTLGAEFTKVSNYTYSVYYQNLCRCDWEHQGLPLGYELGPDVENSLVRAIVDPSLRWQFAGWLRYTLKGEGAIGRPWRPLSTGCCDCEPDCGHVDAWRLSGDVTRTAALGLATRYRPSILFWSGAAVEIWRETQEHHSLRHKYGSTLRLFFSAGGF